MRAPSAIAVALAVAAVVVSACPPSAGAEGRALLDLDSRGWGGYAGPQFKPTVVAGSFCLYGGGPVVFLAGPSLGLGLNVGLPEGDADGLALCYAAARGQYIFPPPDRAGGPRRLHFSLALDAGGGVAWYEGQRAPVAVIEPEALATLSVWKSFRVGLGASYRLAVLLAKLGGFSALELSGPAGVVQLQYGLFPTAAQSTEEVGR